MTKIRRSLAMFAGVILLWEPLGAHAQTSAEEANAANNPLTPRIALDFFDYWAPRLYDSDEYTNSFLLRGVFPHKLGGVPQIFRATMPVQTVPVSPTGTTTGFGDLALFDLFLFKVEEVEIGVGPQLTIPTASKDATGTGKWQAGLSATVVSKPKWGLLGGLLTWQQSFAGASDRPPQNNLTVQPIVFYNLSEGWYLRSTAIWTFDLARGNYVIPIGTGIGKVLPVGGGTTINLFVEPQWTVAHDGAGQPKFQLFVGLNAQFPEGK
jgi:hypothetical protein